MKKNLKPTVTRSLLTLLALSAVPSLFASTHTWSGAQGGFWSQPANWSSGGAPSPFEALPVVIQFPSSGVAFHKTTNNISNLEVDVLAFFGGGFELFDTSFGITLTGSQPPFPYSANVSSSGGGTNFIDDSVTLTLVSNVTVSVANNSTLVLDAPMDGFGGIIKKGPGTLLFAGYYENSYTGPTSVSEGVLTLRKASGNWFGPYGITSIAGALIVGDNDSIQNAFVNVPLDHQLPGTGDLMINPGGAVEVGDDNAARSVSLYGGRLTLVPQAVWDFETQTWWTNYSRFDCGTNLTASPSRFSNPRITGLGVFEFNPPTNSAPSFINVTSGSLLCEPDIYGYTPLHKIGDGEFALAGGDMHHGDWILERGITALSGTYPISQSDHSLTVSNGAQLSLRAACYLGIPTRLNGFGVGGTNGAIVVEHDGAILDSIVQLDSNAAIAVTNSADTLLFTKSSGPAQYPLLSGPGSFTKKGPGRIQLTGNHTNGMTAPLFVDQGVLDLNLTQGLAAVSSPLIIGHNPANGTTAQVRFLKDNQLPAVIPVTINSSGTFNTYGTYQAIGPLILQGGNITTSTGILTLNSDVVATNGAGSLISGNLFLGAAKRSFHLAPGYGVNMQAQISDNGPGVGFDLDGGGTLTLSASNTFSGPINVKEGVLYARNDHALGKIIGGTIIATGARLAVDGRDLGGEPISLAGDGGGYGALSCSKTNTLSGLLTLTADTTINVVGDTDRLTLTTVIKGAGGLSKIGTGTLAYTGASPNTYAGPTVLLEGNLELNKSGQIAIPGPLLVGDDLSPSMSHTVRVLAASQFAANASVVLNASALLDLSSGFSIPQSFGSLFGNGALRLGFNAITVGADNRDAVFGGIITGFGASSITKQGSGTWTLAGTSLQFLGTAVVNGGNLKVMNWLPSGQVTVNPGGNLTGDGLLGEINSLGGVVSPGCCPTLMKLGSKNLSLTPASVFRVQLDGVNGPNLPLSSQLSVNGTVNLGGAALLVSMGFNSAVSNKFIIIDNDSNDSIVGTFKGLSEGATFPVGKALFQITYQGGDGNDVVLTQIGTNQPPKVGAISALPNGSVQLVGNGTPGLTYNVEATPSLTAPVQWLSIGTATADIQGQMHFTDPAAPNFPIRFYRFLLP